MAAMANTAPMIAPFRPLTKWPTRNVVTVTAIGAIPQIIFVKLESMQ